MLKIAVASDRGMVTGHFGHCEGFMFFDTDNKQIIKSETIANPGHRPGFCPISLLIMVQMSSSVAAWVEVRLKFLMKGMWRLL